MDKHRPPRSWRQVDAAEQRLESCIGSKRVEHGIDLEKEHAKTPLLICPIKPFYGLVGFS